MHGPWAIISVIFSSRTDRLPKWRLSSSSAAGWAFSHRSRPGLCWKLATRLGVCWVASGRVFGPGCPVVVPEPRAPSPEPLDSSLRAVDDALLLEGGLGRGEAGDGHAERRARHVVHSHPVAELHRRGVVGQDAAVHVERQEPAGIVA